MQPTVTVLMPNYNNERFLKEAIDSILKQTFINFTFLIVDDGSTDKSVEIIKGYNDPRIVLIQKEQNSGIVDALNIGIKQINSNYLVRMDGDDISLPQRIQTLTDFMEKNPTVGVCSSQMKLFGNDHQITNYYLESDALKAQLIFNSGLSHPCSIFRTSVLKEHHFQYHHTHPYMEDYDLFYRMKDHTTFANINQVLYHYRLSAHNSTVKNQNTALDRKRGLYKYILTDLQIEPTTKNIELHLDLFFKPTLSFAIRDYKKWIDLLILQNRKLHIYPLKALEEILEERWEHFFFKTVPLPINNSVSYFRISKKIKAKHVIYLLKYKFNKLIGRNKIENQHFI